MEIKPIKTEADYRAAMEEVERLFDSMPGTPEGDRLEVLVTLIEAFEEKHYIIPLPDPVEMLDGCGGSGRGHGFALRSRRRHWSPPIAGNASRRDMRIDSNDGSDGCDDR